MTTFEAPKSKLRGRKGMSNLWGLVSRDADEYMTHLQKAFAKIVGGPDWLEMNLDK